MRWPPAMDGAEMAAETPKNPEGQSQADIDAALAAAGAADSPAPSDATPSSASPDSISLPAEASVATMEEPALSQPAAAGIPLDLPDFAGTLHADRDKGISLLGDVKLDVKIELGRAEMYIEDVLKLGEGAVVELDKLAGDPVDVLVNDRLVARGEVLVLNDNFCVRISEILPAAGRAVEVVS